MKEAVNKYADDLAKERAKLGEGESLMRPDDYYEPREGELWRDKKSKLPVVKERRKFLGLF